MDTWIKWIEKKMEKLKKDGMVDLFFYHKFNVRMRLIKKSKKFNESCSLSKAARMSWIYLEYLGFLRLYLFSHLGS